MFQWFTIGLLSKYTKQIIIQAKIEYLLVSFTAICPRRFFTTQRFRPSDAVANRII